MTDAEKKLLQAQHRLEEAQARNRVKERKARTRRLTKAGKTNLNFRWEASGKPGTSSFFSRKGALIHHPEGQWYFLRKTCALRGGCGYCGSLQTMPQHLRVLLSSSAQVTAVSALKTVCSLPAQTCHRQLCLRLCPEA